MHPQKSEAIILHHVDYGEADRIVTLFSRDQGLLKGFAPGARKSRKRFGAALEPLAHVEMQWERGRGELIRLRQADLIDLHEGLRRELVTLTLAGYGCELVQEMFGEGEAHPEVFDLLKGFLGLLAEGGDPRNARLLLELHLLQYSGYVPHMLHCAKCFGVLEPRVTFSVEAEGSLCSACAGSASGLKVDLATLGSLSRCLQVAVQDFRRVRLGATTLAEGALVMAAVFGHLLRRPLKSQPFLHEVWPSGSP